MEQLKLVDKLLLGISFLLASIYTASPNINLPIDPTIIKWFSIFCLIVFACLQKEVGPIRWILVVALFFHSIGDILINQGKDYLLYAIGPFMVGHIFYCILFSRDISKERQISTALKVFIGLLVCYGIGIISVLVPKLPNHLVIAVIIYAIVIVVMAISCLLAGYKKTAIVIGALFYVFSDSMIATNTFVIPITGSHYITWPTYYIAQFCITLGYCFEKR